MRIYKLNKINLQKYYFNIFIYVTLSILLSIALIWLINRLFLEIIPVNLLLFLFLALFAILAQKLAYKKSIEEIIVKEGKKNIEIQGNVISFEKMKKIKLSGVSLSLYPKVTIVFDTEKLSIRICKSDKNYFEFISFIEKLAKNINEGNVPN